MFVGRCLHVRTDVREFGHAHDEDNKSKCLDCGVQVAPCVRCLCYITSKNMTRHKKICRGIRYELQRRGTVGTRQREDGGKFSNKVIRSQRMPGRGENKELFRKDLMLINTTVGKVIPAFQYRNNVVVDARAHHHSAVSHDDYLKQVGEVLNMSNDIFTYKTHQDEDDDTRYYVDFSTVATAMGKRKAQLVRQMKKYKSRVYGIVDIYSASAKEM